MKIISESLSKEQAMQALKEGKKLTHDYMSAHEYVFFKDNYMRGEDDSRISWEIFWRDRQVDGWNRGWYEVSVPPKWKLTQHHRNAGGYSVITSPYGQDFDSRDSMFSSTMHSLLNVFERDKDELKSELITKNSMLELISQAPRFKHNCMDCKWLGRYEEYDLYYCVQMGNIPTVIGRKSDKPADYTSGLGFAKKDGIPALHEALQRAVKIGLITAHEIEKIQ